MDEQTAQLHHDAELAQRNLGLAAAELRRAQDYMRDPASRIDSQAAREARNDLERAQQGAKAAEEQMTRAAEAYRHLTGLAWVERASATAAATADKSTGPKFIAAGVRKRRKRRTRQ